MHAIILAAGTGSRLEHSGPDGRPKCLMEIGGRSLLARQLDDLYRLGIRQSDLVVGYQADHVIEHIATLASRPDIAFHFNPKYDQGSVLSLWAAQETLTSGQAVIVMDADVLYHPGILQRLIETRKDNCYLLDQDFIPGDEPVKIAVRDGLMVEFRKQLARGLSYDMLGESVGFFRFGPDCAVTIAEECARFESEGLGDAPHEEALRNVLFADPGFFGFEDVTGMPWIEIDFPEDVVRATEDILPAIRIDYPDY
jgi:choline kinase